MLTQVGEKQFLYVLNENYIPVQFCAVMNLISNCRIFTDRRWIAILRTQNTVIQLESAVVKVEKISGLY